MIPGRLVYSTDLTSLTKAKKAVYAVTVEYSPSASNENCAVKAEGRKLKANANYCLLLIYKKL